MASLTKEASRLQSEWIVTTEKDIIKIKDFDLPENIFRIRIEFSIDSSFYTKIFTG
jgi:tetraacyldisaccharide-1-P 4'-kinase